LALALTMESVGSVFLDNLTARILTLFGEDSGSVDPRLSEPA
jgi:hypothetical protein